MELSFGTRIRTSPFYERSVEAGITRASVYNHMVIPSSTADPIADYEALTQRVSLWDVGCERQVQVQGPDAAALCQYLSARDLSKQKVGRAKYAPLCDHTGRLINDPVILKLAEDRFWFSIADSDVLLWARAVAGERGYDVEIDEPDVSPLAIQGPRAEDVMAELLGESVRDLKLFWHAPYELDGIPFELCRSGWSKQGGYELFLTDGSRGPELWDRLWAAGMPYGIAVGAPNYIERIESVLLSFGADTDETSDPFEAGIGHMVNLDVAHDFIGKNALLAKREAGAKRVMVGLLIDGPPVEPNPLPLPLSAGDLEAGTARVVVASRRFARNIGIGLVLIEYGTAGTDLDLYIPGTGDGEWRKVIVTTLPFELEEAGALAVAGDAQ